jgi:2,3-diaminopropionate biosynthesis protein SbnA
VDQRVDGGGRTAAVLDSRVPTRLARAVATIGRRQVEITFKTEADNRWGSIKDRTAESLIASVLNRLDGPDPVLVESTSGNLGVALAAIASGMGVRFVAVVDPNLSPALAARLAAFGAELDFVRTADREGGYLTARIARVRELCDRIPGALWTDQYHNQANPLAHYRGTGPEIDRQTGGAIDAVFVAVSTGGTLAGVGRYLHRYRPHVRVVAVDVAGSRVFGRAAGHRRLTGIGASRRSAFLRRDDYDDVAIVNDDAAVASCHALYADTGLHVGGSSGAVLAGCLRYLATHPDIVAPLCLCPDGGESYEQTLYHPRWLAEHGLNIAPDLLRPAPGLPPARFSALPV